MALFRTILCLLAAASLAAAQAPQKGQNPDKPMRGKPEAGITEEGMVDGEAQDNLGAGGKTRVMPARGPQLARYCDFLGSARPSPVLPGGTGTFHIIAVLKGNGVIADLSSARLDYERQQGPIALGEAVWPTPKLGSISPAFAGKPVFEDSMVVTVPLSVAAGTPFGNYALKAKLTVALADGASGQGVGETTTLINAVVRVGETTATVIAPVRPAAEPPHSGAGVATESPANPEPAPQAEAGRPGGQRAGPWGQALAVEPRDAGGGPGGGEPSPLRAEEGGISPAWLAVGGFLALAVLFVLLRRKS